MMIEDFKKFINNSIKEIWDNIRKKLEAFKEETQSPLKSYMKTKPKQVKVLNKNIQDLKMEIETIKKSQRETTLEIKNYRYHDSMQRPVQVYDRQHGEGEVDTSPTHNHKSTCS